MGSKSREETKPQVKGPPRQRETRPLRLLLSLCEGLPRSPGTATSKGRGPPPADIPEPPWALPGVDKDQSRKLTGQRSPSGAENSRRRGRTVVPARAQGAIAAHRGSLTGAWPRGKLCPCGRRERPRQELHRPRLERQQGRASRCPQTRAEQGAETGVLLPQNPDLPLLPRPTIGLSSDSALGGKAGEAPGPRLVGRNC